MDIADTFSGSPAAAEGTSRRLMQLPEDNRTSLSSLKRKIVKGMPFTFSHAAAAIPFRRTRLIMSAVVMGCFVPDFPRFLFLSPHRSFGHTIAGMFVFDLPLAMVALWLFHAFLKRPMLLFLPDGILRRLTTGINTFSFWPAERLSLIVLSILTGTATHLGWDAFTHRNSWIYRHWAFLRQRDILPVAGEVRLYKLLEYGSSVLGLAVIAVWIWHWYRNTRPCDAPIALPGNATQRRIFMIVAPILAALGGALRAWHENGVHLRIRPIVHFTTDMLISGTTFLLAALLACGVIFRRYRDVPGFCPSEPEPLAGAGRGTRGVLAQESQAPIDAGLRRH